jgi:hypothetical protein
VAPLLPACAGLEVIGFGAGLNGCHFIIGSGEISQ